MLFGHFRVATSWSAAFKHTVHEIDEDNCLGLAAQLAFYFLLALFPALLFLVGLIAYTPAERALPDLIAELNRVAPAEMVRLISRQIEEIAETESAGLLTFGFLGAVWSSSVAMVAIIDALNHAYDVTEWRPWWKRRLVAIVLTGSLALLGLIGLVFILIGPGLAERIAAWFGLAPAVAITWRIVRWPVVIFCIVTGVDLVYHFAPNRPAPWAWITPGGILATLLWIGTSLGFKFYLTRMADYAATYGTIGGIIVTMLWFYLCGLAILVGAELNGVMEQEWRAERRRAV